LFTFQDQQKYQKAEELRGWNVTANLRESNGSLPLGSTMSLVHRLPTLQTGSSSGPNARGEYQTTVSFINYKSTESSIDTVNTINLPTLRPMKCDPGF